MGVQGHAPPGKIFKIELQKDGDPDRKIGGPDFRYGKAEYFFKRLHVCYILKLTIHEWKSEVLTQKCIRIIHFKDSWEL